MRGVPNHPVSCSRCGAERGCAKDRLCHSCRVTAVSIRRRRHQWSAELDEHLRRTYQSANNRPTLVDNITYLQRMTGFPRSVIVSRASALGLASKRGKQWSTDEISRLRESTGTHSLSIIARELGRSYYSVKGQFAKLRISARVTEGYSQEELRSLLGVSSRQVQRWITLRWIKLSQGRITESGVTRFLRRHPEQYQLNRVDEAWFKGLLFPAFNSVRADSEKFAREGTHMEIVLEPREFSLNRDTRRALNFGRNMTIVGDQCETQQI